MNWTSSRVFKGYMKVKSQGVFFLCFSKLGFVSVIASYFNQFILTEKIHVSFEGCSLCNNSKTKNVPNNM